MYFSKQFIKRSVIWGLLSFLFHFIGALDLGRMFFHANVFFLIQIRLVLRKFNTSRLLEGRLCRGKRFLDGEIYYTPFYKFLLYIRR